MSKTVPRIAAGALAAGAALALAAPAGAATKLPGTYGEAPHVAIATAAGRVWFSASGNVPNGSGAVGRVTSAKISRGKLTSLIGTKLGPAARYSGGRFPLAGGQAVLQAPDGSAIRAGLKSNGRLAASRTVADALVPIKDAIMIGPRLVMIGGAGLVVRSGAAVGNLGAVAGGFPNNVRLRRDRGGRLWAAWVGFAGVGSAGTTVRMQQLHPTTLQPVGDVQVAPVTYAPFDDVAEVDLACAATCRVVFTHGTQLLSWKPGEAKAATIARNVRLQVGAVATASGKVVTAYIAGGKLQVRRGGANGAGGKVRKASLGNGTYVDGELALSGSNAVVALSMSSRSNWRAVGQVVALP